MNKVHNLSIDTIIRDAGMTPAMLLERINSIAYKQLLTSIKERNFSDKAKKEYVEAHIKQYEMSRATLYNILKNKKASRRKAILIRQTLEQIIKEKNLYKNLDINISLEEYDR